MDIIMVKESTIFNETQLFLIFLLLANMNNMRLASPDGWYSAYYFQGYPFPPFFNSAQRHVEVSIIIKLLFMIFICISIL
jgi:hypothetical protein